MFEFKNPVLDFLKGNARVQKKMIMNVILHFESDFVLCTAPKCLIIVAWLLKMVI